MAKNLAYVKRYEEDLADLGLCFEWTEDVMGRMESYELKKSVLKNPAILQYSESNLLKKLSFWNNVHSSGTF